MSESGPSPYQLRLQRVATEAARRIRLGFDAGRVLTHLAREEALPRKELAQELARRSREARAARASASASLSQLSLF
jgi:hypothetical protein